ncbi:MAG: thioredoxin-disulfide reductase [Bacillaceae bacterium G1]|nr:thioredoxin-disulfide reductase [Bacillota bacterium]OJF18070.1 MAG: thioredoxin-disulfide reductase [Bacillaceae bacterium G1]
MSELYDLVIIGGGPAGLAAGVYAGRAGLKTVIVEKGLFGGQMQNTGEVENYPGIRQTTGPELSEVMGAHPEDFGVEKKYGEVRAVQLEGPIKTVDLGKEQLQARAIIIATGAVPKKLGVKGEEEYSGRGVSYCAICDGAFFNEKRPGMDKGIVVVGGGDSAVEEGVFLTRFNKVTLVHRRDKLRAQPILQKRAFENERMSFVWNSVVEEIVGDGKLVTGVRIRNRETGEESFLPANAVFIYIGNQPNTDFLPKDAPFLTENGYIRTDEQMRTGIPGVFAAGDVREKTLRQIITAAADGAIAAMEAYHYIESLKEQAQEAQVQA